MAYVDVSFFMNIFEKSGLAQVVRYLYYIVMSLQLSYTKVFWRILQEMALFTARDNIERIL